MTSPSAISTENTAPKGTDWLQITLFVCSVALAVLVALLSRENLRLKAVVSRPVVGGVALGDEPPRAGEVFSVPMLTDFSGEPRRLPLEGRTTLLLLANPDCHACEDEWVAWQRFLTEVPAGSVDAFAVLLNVEASPPPQWLELPGAEVLLCPEAGGTLDKVPQTPAAILIDAKGRVHDIWIGPLAGYRDQLLYRLSMLD